MRLARARTLAGLLGCVRGVGGGGAPPRGSAPLATKPQVTPTLPRIIYPHSPLASSTPPPHPTTFHLACSRPFGCLCCFVFLPPASFLRVVFFGCVRAALSDARAQWSVWRWRRGPPPPDSSGRGGGETPRCQSPVGTVEARLPAARFQQTQRRRTPPLLDFSGRGGSETPRSLCPSLSLPRLRAQRCVFPVIGPAQRHAHAHTRTGQRWIGSRTCTRGQGSLQAGGRVAHNGMPVHLHAPARAEAQAPTLAQFGGLHGLRLARARTLAGLLCRVPGVGGGGETPRTSAPLATKPQAPPTLPRLIYLHLPLPSTTPPPDPTSLHPTCSCLSVCLCSFVFLPPASFSRAVFSAVGRGWQWRVSTTENSRAVFWVVARGGVRGCLPNPVSAPSPVVKSKAHHRWPLDVTIALLGPPPLANGDQLPQLSRLGHVERWRY